MTSGKRAGAIGNAADQEAISSVICLRDRNTGSIWSARASDSTVEIHRLDFASSISEIVPIRRCVSRANCACDRFCPDQWNCRGPGMQLADG